MKKATKKEKKELSKKGKITIAVVLAVLLAAGVGLGIYFGLKEKKAAHETTYSDTFREVNIIDDSTIEFSYACPFLEGQPQFYVENARGFYMTYTDSKNQTVTINGEIIEAPKYVANKVEGLQGGTLTLKIKFDKKLQKENTLYHAVLKENSISYKKDNYVNKEIVADFYANATETDSWESSIEKYANAKTVIPSNVEVNLTKDDKNGYFSVSAQIPGVTQFNAVATQNFEALLLLKYKNENGTFIRYINKDVEFKAENGKIFIKGTIGLEDLIPGQDYDIVIQKGVFINDDKSVVNDEYTCKYTYVE